MNPFKKKKNVSEQILILDSCGLIDGRIVDIARIGFVPQNILIPQFIIAELQFLADHGDSHKRERARYGLDVIRMLQDLRRTNVVIARERFKNVREVDDKLVALAKQYGALLYTTDYNLNKVAQIEGVEVLNVNELAQAMRPNRLPGEKMEIKITQVGQDKTQGVGYLDDGTMVVVERAGNKVGQKIVVEFSRMLQTAAGKMMFAVLPQDSHEHSGKKAVTSEVATQQKQSQPIKAYHAAPTKRKIKDKAHSTERTITHAGGSSQPQHADRKNKTAVRKGPAAHGRRTNPGAKPVRSTTSSPQRGRRRLTPEDSLIAAIKSSHSN